MFVECSTIERTNERTNGGGGVAAAAVAAHAFVWKTRNIGNMFPCSNIDSCVANCLLSLIFKKRKKQKKNTKKREKKENIS